MDDFDENAVHIEMYLHLIWFAKDDRPLISPRFSNQLFRYIGDLALERESCVMAIGGTEDHIHLLVKVSPDFCLSHFMKEMKECTAMWIRTTFADSKDFEWDENDCSFSVGVEDLEFRISMITDQENVHKTKSVKDEIDEEFAPAHGAYDCYQEEV